MVKKQKSHSKSTNVRKIPKKLNIFSLKIHKGAGNSETCNRNNFTFWVTEVLCIYMYLKILLQFRNFMINIIKILLQFGSCEIDFMKIQ